MNVTLNISEPAPAKVSGLSPVLLFSADAVVLPDQFGPSDSGIFLFRKGLSDASPDKFQDVCTAVQMLSLPATRESVSPAGLYRRNAVTAAVLSIGELSELKQSILDRVQALTNEWNVIHSGLVTSSVVTVTPGGSSGSEVQPPVPSLAANAEFNEDRSKVIYRDRLGNIVGVVNLSLP